MNDSHFSIRSLLLRLGAVAGASLLLASVPAPRAVKAAPLLTATQILAANARARGGLDAWHSITTLSEKGHIEHGQLHRPQGPHPKPKSTTHSMDQALPFTLQFKRPHKMRLEMALGDATALQLFDGQTGWTLQPSAKGPLIHQYSPNESAAAAEQVDPEGPVLDALAKGTTVDFDAEETVEGHRAYKLKLTLKNGAVRHAWIDADTFLDLKIDGVRVIEDRYWPTETYFYDWKRTAGGLMLPHRIETAVGEVRTSSRIVVERVLVNLPLSDDLFSVPASVATPAAPVPAAENPAR